jgi:hypothetical protein
MRRLPSSVVLLLVCQCGPPVEPPTDGGVVDVRAVDASDACAVTPLVCGGMVTTCTGCQTPTLLASCQTLVETITVDDTSVYWQTAGGMETKLLSGGGRVAKCAKTGCGGMPTLTPAALTTVASLSQPLQAIDGTLYANDDSADGGGSILAATFSSCNGTTFSPIAGLATAMTSASSALYFADGSVWQYNTQSLQAPVAVWTAPGGVQALGIVSDGNLVYWTTTDGQIMACTASVCPQGPTTLLKGTYTFSTFMAVDDTSVYASSMSGVVRCAKSGCQGSAAVVAPAHGAFATDGTDVYWLQSGIVKCPVTGCTAGPTLVGAALQPGGVAVDATDVYWTDTTAGLVLMVPK